MRYRDLPDDMQVLLVQFLEDRDGVEVDVDALLDLHLSLIDVCVAEQVESARKEPWDYRGPAHVLNFQGEFAAGNHVPPIVVENGRWIDGRHRILAADAAGVTSITGIDWQAFKQAVIMGLRSAPQP